MNKNMKKKNGSINKLFYVILVLLTLIFIATALDRGRNIFSHYTRENENYAKLIANSTKSYFNQIEMIIELVGNHLLTNDNYKNTRDAKAIFERMLLLNDAIAGYALLSPEGNVLISQLDTPPESLPNVLSVPEARDSFLQTLNEKRMVIGRTYFLTHTQKMVIPVRKAFYDAEGKPRAVMVVAVDAYKSDIFDASILQSEVSTVHIFRDRDRYRQLYLESLTRTHSERDTSVYKNPIPEADFQAAMKKITDKTGLSLETFKGSHQSTSISFQDLRHNEEVLISDRKSVV